MSDSSDFEATLDRSYLDPASESLSSDLERPEILAFWRGIFD